MGFPPLATWYPFDKHNVTTESLLAESHHRETCQLIVEVVLIDPKYNSKASLHPTGMNMVRG